MKTVVLGLGNPILSDDGIGLRVAKALQSKINQSYGKGGTLID